MRQWLVLFDIDGTLLSAGQVFRRALSEALLATYEQTGDIDGFEYSGKTDPQIVRELMHGAGLSNAAIDAHLREALALYERLLLPLLLTAGSVQAKPGVPSVLELLQARSEVTLGLLTGNMERCARAKLTPLGLNRFFPFGAFGSDAEDRHLLPALAVNRALDCTGRRFSGKQIVVVGDSIHDVRCGRSLGVRAVAVASGKTARQTLAAECPDLLCDSLSDPKASVDAILGDQ